MSSPDSDAAFPPLGFIGLGAMGGAMVRTLLAAGHAVLGYDINEERLAQAAAAGVEPAESGAEKAIKERLEEWRKQPEEEEEE